MNKKAILILGILGCVFSLQGDEPAAGGPYTEIIIKVKPGVIVIPAGKAEAELCDVEINSEGLKELNEEFGLAGIERAFAAKSRKEDPAQEYPDLENVYIFSFPPGADTGIIINRYGELEDVVYAEENRTLSIY